MTDAPTSQELYQALYDRLSVPDKVAALIASYGVAACRHDDHHNLSASKDSHPIGIVPVNMNNSSFISFLAFPKPGTPSYAKLEPVIAALGIQSSEIDGASVMVTQSVPYKEHLLEAGAGGEFHAKLDALLEARRAELNLGTWTSKKSGGDASRSPEGVTRP